MVSVSLVVRVLAVATAVNGYCDLGWHEYSFYCYYFSSDDALFDEASANCRHLGGELAYVGDMLENYYMYLTGVKPGGQSYWIGLERILGPIWRWTANGQAPTYSGWDLGEPDGEGDCARMTPYGVGGWRDWDCEANLTYICKKHADCGDPPALDHSTTWTSRDRVASQQSDRYFYSMGTVAEFKCVEGFEFPDQLPTKTSMCSLGGQWLPNLNETTQCERKMCGPPPLLKKMYYNGSDEYYGFGSVISYRCFDGYRFNVLDFNVTKYLRCGDDKRWFGDTIEDCTPLYCQRPITANAISNTTVNLEGTYAHYRCLKGYKYVDNTTEKVFRCLNDYWQPPRFQCIRKRCVPHNVAYATPDTNITYTGTTVNYYCDKGRLFPDTKRKATMYCQDNEEWDHLIKDECERKRCLSPPPNNTASRTHNHNSSHTYKYEATITYTCIADWVFKDSSNTRDVTCNEDGEWQPQDVGECVGDPIEVVTVYHPPVEVEKAEVFGSLGYILLAIILIGLVVLDLTTIGKHIALMKARIGNDQEALKKHREERRKEIRKKKEEKEKKERRIRKTVITTKEYRKKMGMQRGATRKTLDLQGLLLTEEEAEKDRDETFTVVDETNDEEKAPLNADQPSVVEETHPPPEKQISPAPEQAPESKDKKEERAGSKPSLKSRDSKQSIAVFHGEQDGQNT